MIFDSNKIDSSDNDGKALNDAQNTFDIVKIEYEHSTPIQNIQEKNLHTLEKKV